MIALIKPFPSTFAKRIKNPYKSTTSASSVFLYNVINKCDEIPPIVGMTQRSTLEEQPKLPHRLIATSPY